MPKLSGTMERRVNHIATRPPKNITSLASQTIVPICVGLGRPTAGTADGGRSVKVAVVTSPLCRVVRISALSPRRTSTPPGTAPGEPGQHIPPDAPSNQDTHPSGQAAGACVVVII